MLNYANFFGGPEEMQKKLCAAVCDARDRLSVDEWRSMTQRFHYDFEAILRDPKRMTSSAFSECSFVLDLNVDEALGHDFTPSETAAISKDIGNDRSGVIDTVHGANALMPPGIDDQVAVLATYQALAEMDKIAVT